MPLQGLVTMATSNGARSEVASPFFEAGKFILLHLSAVARAVFIELIAGVTTLLASATGVVDAADG